MSAAYTFNGAGRLVTVLSGAAVAPLARNGALTFDANGALLIVQSGAVPDAVANNWPFSPTGELKVNITDTPLVGPIQASLTRAVGSSQQIWCSQNNAIASWSEGLPFDAGGNLCIGAGGSGGDPFFANVATLLHFDGTNGSTTVTDNSPLAAAWVCGAGTTLATATPAPLYGTASLNCAAGNAGLTSSNAGYNIGAGDFTVEWGYYQTAAQDVYAFDLGDSSTANRLRFNPSFSGPARSLIEVAGANVLGNTAGSVLTLSAWHQLAVSRVSGTMYYFIDGTLINSVASATNFNWTAITIGKSITGNFPATCRFDEFRLTKGVGRYTASYTPAAAPFPNN